MTTMKGTKMTAGELQKIGARYRRALARADEARKVRDAAIVEALVSGLSQAEVAEAAGLTRGRVSQMAMRLERTVSYRQAS